MLLTVACQRMGTSVGNLVLQVSSGNPGTKEELEPTPTAENGELFNNLLIVITDSNLIPLTMVPSVQYWAGSATNSKGLEFRNIPTGTYEVFAFANIDPNDTWGSGLKLNEISANPTNISSICSAGKIAIDRLFTSLSSGSTPNTENLGTSGMLLTGRQTVTIDADHVSGTVTLIRPVARLRVLLRNHTGKDVTLNSLTFSDFNASTSYLLDHRNSTTGLPTIPPSVSSYGPIPAASTNQIISADTIEKEVYSKLLFENSAPLYKMFAQVTVGSSPGAIAYLGGSLDEGSVLKRIDNYSHIATAVTYIQRNEELTVVMNVYSGSTIGSFVVSADNWENGGGGSHTFQ